MRLLSSAVGQEMLGDREEMLGDWEEILGDQEEMLSASQMTPGKSLRLCMLGHLSPKQGRHLLLSLCLSLCPTSVPVQPFKTYQKALWLLQERRAFGVIPCVGKRHFGPWRELPSSLSIACTPSRNISSDLLSLLHFSLSKWVKVLQEFDGRARNRAQVLSVRV